MTDFDLLEGPSGRKFLHIHTDQTTYIVEISDDELDELRERLDEPPTPIRNNG
jgi:hypothetical protein